MMINNMKAYELNDMEMKDVAGGHDVTAILQAAEHLERNTAFDGLDEKISEAASTAWEVVKHAFEVCG